MWHDHPCSQRNKVTKRAMEMVGGDEEGGGGFWKKNGRQYRGVFMK